MFIKLIINNVSVIFLIDSSIIYSLSSIYRVSGGHCPYYNTGYSYSDTGTKYGHLRYLLNKNIK